MMFDKELSQKLDCAFKNVPKNGLQDFLTLIHFNDKDSNEFSLLTQEDVDIVWYPGCGGDISPCTVLGEKDFEKKNNIEAKSTKLYIFTDPGSDFPGNDHLNLCLKAYGGNQEIYDNTVEDSGIYNYVRAESLNVDDIYIEHNGNKIVTGYSITLVRNSFTYRIIYLRMPQENFLLDVIRVFNLKIKWMFYINMNHGAGFIASFITYNIDFPEWVCTNRIHQYGINDYSDLKEMLDELSNMYTIYDKVYFGQMSKTERIFPNRRPFSSIG